MTKKSRLSTFTHSLKAAGNLSRKRVLKVVDHYPLISFFSFLALLIFVAAIGNKLRAPAVPAANIVPPAKQVQTYQLDGAPSITVQAKIEKSGSITLVAQTAGVVQRIQKQAGDKVSRGSTILSLSTNYQGGNAAVLSSEIAQKNAAFSQDNYQNQTDLINRQKDLAGSLETQASELRAINRQSQDANNNLMSQESDLINSLSNQLTPLIANNINNVNQAAITQLQSSRISLQGAFNSLQAGERTLEYQASDANTPANLAKEQRDITLKQLDLQQKTTDLNRDISALNLQISQVTAALMFPASPCDGTVERVFVKVGQAVQPGTILATIRGTDDQATAYALVSQQLAGTISRILPSQFSINGKSVAVIPTYVSQEPTDGTLFSVIYHLPTMTAADLANNSWVPVSIPLTNQNAHLSQSIPLDSVYQTQAQAYVYVVGQNQQGSPSAMVKPVELGQVFGQFVEVKSGLDAKDQVIVDRNVLDGDLVKVK